MEDISNRKRSVNIENLSEEQVDQIIQEINKKIIEIVDCACNDANKLLNIYGLRAKMQIAFEPIEKE